MGMEDQIVLVTGGSRGIGRAVALRLARERPAHLAIGYCLDHEAARRTVAELEAMGVAASAIAADLGHPEQVDELFARLGERCGRLDVFVSNAARAAFRPAIELSVRSFQRTLDINAQAFLLGSRRAAELMGERGGRIVGVSSLGAHTCAPGYAALGAAKAALEALARYLAVELAPRGINVNVVCGGLIDTPSLRSHPRYAELAARVRERTPAARLGRPEDLAGVVAFLCGPESDWIRGQTLIADGGFSVAP
jgi:enoyl-[acyl-carrier protein] reductase III